MIDTGSWPIEIGFETLAVEHDFFYAIGKLLKPFAVRATHECSTHATE